MGVVLGKGTEGVRVTKGGDVGGTDWDNLSPLAGVFLDWKKQG